MGYWKDLLRSNTGVSSKTFVMVLAAIAGVFTLGVVVFILIVDLFTDKQIKTDLFGIAAVITAIATLIGASIYGKVSSEKYEPKAKPSQEPKEEF